MNKYEQIYRKMVQLGIFIEGGAPQRDYARSVSGGFMDLIVERVPWMDGTKGGVAFSLAHYFEMNGDLCKDPEMVVRVYPGIKMAEALTFQRDIPPLYQEVYPDENHVYPRLKVQLNGFLGTWLSNLKAQGHGKTWHNTTGLGGPGIPNHGMTA